MTKRLALLAAVLLVSLPALAVDAYQGTITATASTNNLTTGTPFTLGQGARVSIQCDADSYVAEGTGNTVSVTAANGLKITAGSLFDIALSSNQTVIAVLPVSGTANCKVFASVP